MAQERGQTVLGVAAGAVEHYHQRRGAVRLVAGGYVEQAVAGGVQPQRLVTARPRTLRWRRSC